jgi:hypothetical protein
MAEGVLGPEGFAVTESRLAGDLGIEAGDTIVSIDAQPPRGLLAVMTAVQRDPDRATVLVEIDRGRTWLVYAYRVRSAAAPVGLAHGAIIEGDGDRGR